MSNSQKPLGPQRPPGPQKLGDILAELILRRGYARAQAQGDYDRAWRDAVGEVLAPQTRVGGATRGILRVVVASSAISQELSFRKSEILARLKQSLPAEKIRDLRCRVGPLV